MRKVYITVPVSLIIQVDAGVKISQVMDELSINATITDDSKTFNDAQIEQTDCGKYEITLTQK
jgi:hypothetical protein